MISNSQDPYKLVPVNTFSLFIIDYYFLYSFKVEVTKNKLSSNGHIENRF